MSKEKMKIEERIQKIESILFQRSNLEIPVKLVLPNDVYYISTYCGKCGYLLGSIYPLSEIWENNFFNKYCPMCGNKTIFDKKLVENFKPICEERKKRTEIVSAKNEEITRLKERRKRQDKTSDQN